MSEKAELGGSTGARLVCGHGRRMYDEFSVSFTNLAWARDACFAGLNKDLEDAYVHLRVEMALHAAAAFFRRIVKPCEESQT